MMTQVIRRPPHMTFTNDWAAVVNVFLDYATSELEQYVDRSRIALLGTVLSSFMPFC